MKYLYVLFCYLLDWSWGIIIYPQIFNEECRFLLPLDPCLSVIQVLSMKYYSSVLCIISKFGE